MKQLLGTEEAARIRNVSPRTIERWHAVGKLEGEFRQAEKGGGKSGQKLYVIIDDTEPQRGESIGHSEIKKNQPCETISRGDDEHKDRYKIHRGEPGCHVVTEFKDGEPIINIDGLLADALPADVLSAAPSAPAILSPPGDTGADVSSQKNLPAIIPAIYNDKEEKSLPERKIPELCQKTANFRFAFIQKIKEELTKEYSETLPLFKNGNGKLSKTKRTYKILDIYNSGILLPQIHGEIGSISRATLYNWLQLYNQGGIDALVPQYRGPRSSGISAAEKNFLLTKLLDQNKPTVGDAINKCKFLLGDESPSSAGKLRRWVNQFKRENYDIWTLNREGEKALNDKCVPYAEREWRDLAVGEAVVADGHKLNFQVINPFTGKPTRAMMVLFWDWKSSYPLGWEIMLTESIQCVVAALRNAIITLGKFPKHALLDNGKAFRANLFRKEFRFQETEIPGIFERLSISPHFAMPYNAQSKPIERFFRTFNDWFEREMPSYTGASIADKPAHMNRNEKRAKALHNEWVPTIPEAMELILRWREYYIDQELGSRDGLRPRDIFEAEKGPGVDPFALHFLMMTCKARMVHRNGITFNGWHWYHENLYGFKDYVLMFYSYYDLSQVYVFTTKNEFLCVAKPVEKVNPFAADSEFPEDMAAVRRSIATQRRVVKATKKLSDLIQSQQGAYIDYNRAFRDRPEVAGAIRQIENKKNPAKVVSLSTPEEIESHEIRAESESSPLPETYERYDILIKKEKLTELEEAFINGYISGEIAPGEWETIYGGKERFEPEKIQEDAN